MWFSWENHILCVSSIVKKKINALRKISLDISQAELLNIAHGSNFSVLHYAACTWLNEALQEKTSQKNKGSLKFHTADYFWKEQTRIHYWSTLQPC